MVRGRKLQPCGKIVTTYVTQRGLPALSRNIYLEDISLEEATERWWRALAMSSLDQPLPGEWVALAQARGRVTAEPVWALTSSPHYHASAMDGYAVRAGR